MAGRLYLDAVERQSIAPDPAVVAHLRLAHPLDAAVGSQDAAPPLPSQALKPVDAELNLSTPRKKQKQAGASATGASTSTLLCKRLGSHLFWLALRGKPASVQMSIESSTVDLAANKACDQGYQVSIVDTVDKMTMVAPWACSQADVSMSLRVAQWSHKGPPFQSWNPCHRLELCSTKLAHIYQACRCRLRRLQAVACLLQIAACPAIRMLSLRGRRKQAC